MAKRKKGRAVNGWLVIDKPVGLTSSHVVNKVRWAFDAKKAGHAGTLDPLATGVVAVALGEATKTVPYVTDALKAYRFTVKWGEATNTDDAEGEVTQSSGARPSEADINAALPAFRGEIQQVPPQFSAVKVNGERAYARARDGEHMELAARPLWVESLELVNRDQNEAELEMICGKGGYVRSVARDLGEALGCFGHVTALRRIWSGPFQVGDALSIETLERLAKTEALDEYLAPVDVGLTDLAEARCDAVAAAKVRQGHTVPVTFSTADYGETCWLASGGTPLAIGTYRGGMFEPKRVLLLGD
jgi:tRNA pseudouridine55 synthase